MHNSQIILETLDKMLAEPIGITLHLLGGAAFDLVYSAPRFSEDVDLMCSVDECAVVESPVFNEAIVKTNQALESRGLYITHVFDEHGLVHTRTWLERLVTPPPDAPAFKNFTYDAVGPEDIILSKLTRFDDKDKEDIRALMEFADITKQDINDLLGQVVIPEVWLEAWQKGLPLWHEWSPSKA